MRILSAVRGLSVAGRPVDAWIPAAGVVLVALSTGYVLAAEQYIRIGVAAAACVLMVAMAGRVPQHGLVMVAVWFTALGLLRRVLDGDRLAGLIDPLLIIGPLTLVVLFLTTSTMPGFRRRSSLSRYVLLLQLMFAASALNPRQGSLTAGAAGVLVICVPMLAFWVGRMIADDAMLRRVLGWLAVLSVPAAMYGLFQTYRGFPAWDQRWIDEFGYAALKVRGVTRSFSVFSSSAEYAAFAAFAMLVSIWLPRRLSKLPSAAVALLLAVAVVLIGSRGAVVGAFLGLVVTSLARLGVRGRTALVLIPSAALLIPSIVAWAAPSSFDKTTADRLLEHQVEGLGDPLGDDSSLRSHIDLVATGVRSLWREPIGLGVGSITNAGVRLGAQNQGTEADPSNVAIAIGIPGFVVFALLVVGALRVAYRVALRRRDGLSLCALGLLSVTMLQWVSGGQYAVAWLVWFVIGWLDRTTAEEQAVAENPMTDALRPA